MSDTPEAFAVAAAAAAAAATAAAITVGAHATQQALQQQQVPNTGSYLGIPSYHTTANDDVSAITSASSVSSKNSLTEVVQLATAAQAQVQAQAQAQAQAQSVTQSILGALGGGASLPIAPSQQPQYPAPGVYDALLANIAAAQQQHAGVNTGAAVQKRRSPAGNPQLVPLGMPAPGPDGTIVQPNKRRKGDTVPPPGGPQPPSAIPTAMGLDLASLSAAASVSTTTTTGSMAEQQPASTVVAPTGLLPMQHTTLPTAVTPAAGAPVSTMAVPIGLPPPPSTATPTAPPAAPVSAAASVATSATGTISPPVVAELDPHQKAEIAKNMLYKAYMAALTASEE